MAGPNLEVFKFGLYLFFPIVMMVQFGNADWYNRNVLPVCITHSGEVKSLRRLSSTKIGYFLKTLIHMSVFLSPVRFFDCSIFQR